MAIKWEKVQAGMTLFDCHKQKAGNTTLSRWGTWTVLIVSIDHDNGVAVVRWNGNQETKWYRSRITELFAKVPPSVLKSKGLL